METKYITVKVSSSSSRVGQMSLFKLSNYSILCRAGCAVVLRPWDFRRDSSPASPVKDESSLAQVNDDEKKADDRLDLLAVHLLRHGTSWSLSKMETLLQGWRVDDDTRMGSIRESFKEAALALSVHQSRPSFLQRSTRTAFSLLAPTVSDRYLVKLFKGHMLTAESEHGLCSKREVIISKFDALLVKMGGVELAIKIENGQATHLSMEAERSWQKAETMYRLRMEEVKESQGALKLAEDEYSK